MAKDPYKYFRIEARELLEGLTQGILNLEKGAITPELVAVLLRNMHTLKGAARVVKQGRISELAHKLEDTLAPYRDAKAPIPKERIDELLRLLDGVSAGIGNLDAPGEPEQKPAQARPTEEAPLESVRVAVGEMDELLEGIGELGTKLASVRRDAEDAAKARQLSEVLAGQIARLSSSGGNDKPALGRVLMASEELRVSLSLLQRSLAEDVGQAGVELAQARDAAHQLRLLPAEVVFATLERTSRDAAHALDKQIRFETSGGETRLDAHVLAALRDALLHLVRNAVAHGIEAAPKRKAEGKPPEGLVRLKVERRGGNVAIVCEDDGAGIDVAAVRKAAISRGLVSEADAARLGTEDVVQLLLRGGVTTTGSVTEVSGRGIGLDVVRATTKRLKGDIRVHTEQGKGTSIEIVVPVSLASLPTLRVESAGIAGAIPLSAVREVVRLGDEDLTRTGDGVSFFRDGRSIPFLPLSSLLGKTERSAGASGRRSAVIVEASSGTAALGVERLLGPANIVVRSLPSFVRAEAFVAGASADLEGTPELVFDPAQLVLGVRAAQSMLPANAAPPRPRILVIDDSLTTRMLEQSILESAGYLVDAAISAEEGLEKARRESFALFVVDVEMPGMDGYAFVERVRADAELAGTPCILVTSRGSTEDRLRGQKAGARAYIVKSEFDQGLLLQTIRNLVG